jgi:hypothetical protein
MGPEYIRLVWAQATITIIGAALTFSLINQPAAKSVLYGSGIALVSTLFLALRLKQGNNNMNLGAEWALRQAYRTAIERYVWTGIMLGTGFGLLKLVPQWMLAGFVVVQSAWLLIPIWIKLRKQNDN